MGSIKISAFCPTFNSEKFVGYAIGSVLHVVDEIIVVDSNSVDHTIDIVESFKSPKIHIYQTENDLDKKFQFGLEQMTGNVVMRLDDDWVWEEGIRRLRGTCQQEIERKKKGILCDVYNIITCRHFSLPVHDRMLVWFQEGKDPIEVYGSYRTDNLTFMHRDEKEWERDSRWRRWVRQKYSVRKRPCVGHWKMLKDTKEEFVRKWSAFNEHGGLRPAEEEWVRIHKARRKRCPPKLLGPLYRLRNQLVPLGGFDICKLT